MHSTSRSVFRVVASASAIVVLLSLVLSSGASANPVPVEEDPEVVVAVFGLLFLMNLPVNVFWYCAGILALSKTRMLSFTKAPGFFGKPLSRKALGAAALITLFGAMIDMFSGGDNTFWFKEVGEEVLVALVLVFVSVLLVSLVVPRLRTKPSLLMAGGMALMNLVHWTVIASVFYGDGPAENPAPFVVAYGIVCAVLSVFVVRAISRTVQRAPQSQVAPGKVG